METTECLPTSTSQLEIFQVKNKPVVVSETAVCVSSNAGFLALGQLERRFGFLKSVLPCFQDFHRQRATKDPDRVEHSLADLLSQRVFQMASGYEDGLDADTLRHDPLLQLAVGKEEPLGSQPMMSRLENWVSWKDLYRAWRQMVAIFARDFYVSGDAIVLHLDSTNDPVHGQLGLFNGYYREHCFHPLIVMEEKHAFPLAIFMRPGPVGSAHQAKAILQRLICWLREEIPEVKIIIKGDCSFGTVDLIEYFDAIKIDYVLGLSGNAVLYRHIADLEVQVQTTYDEMQKPLQQFCSFSYRAESWEKPHAVVAKVEHTGQGLNRRFVVSSLWAEDPGCLYATYHTRAKGIEATIEQLKNGLRFEKTACHAIRPNQMRYLEAALALVFHLKIMEPFRKKWPHLPTVQTLIQKVLKVAAIVTTSMRRHFIQLSAVDPNTRHLMLLLQT